MYQKGMTPMVNTSIRLPQEYKDILREIAAIERRQPSDCIRIAIEEYIDKKIVEHNIKGI